MSPVWSRVVTLNGNSLDVDPSDASFQSLAAGDTQDIVVTYDIEDGNGGSVAQTATVTITGTNDAPTVAAAITASADEDAAGFSVDLLQGASDVDNGDTLNVANVAGLVAGVTLNGNSLDVDPSDASFQSLAAGDTQDIVVTYDIEDGNGGSVAQTATVTITGTNDAPTVAAAITASADEDAAGFSVDLLQGASDVDNGDTLNVANVAGLVAGVTLNGNSLDVDPSDASFQSLAAGDTQDIVVTYDIEDGNGGSVAQTATVTITGTNDAPTVAAAITASADEDAAGFSVDLLQGASDVDNGDTLNVANVAGLVAGVTLNGNSLDVDPSDASFQSLAAGDTQDIVVTYDIEDGNGGSVAQTATVTITGTNDAPTVAAAITASADEDAAGFSVELLQGASDVDNGDTLNVANVAGLVAGVTLNGKFP